MKKLLTLISILIFLSSCGEPTEFPFYSLDTIQQIPDSLKEKHRAYITETIRAASQHMSAGEYEHVDLTIIEAERLADRLYSVPVLGLKKHISYSYLDDILITPEQMTDQEKTIFNELLNKGQ